MSEPIIEIVSPAKKIFFEKAQDYIHDFKNQILDLDAELTDFGEQLDGLIATNKSLQETAIKADLYVPDSPFGKTIDRFETSLQLLRDRPSKADWITKGLFIEVVNMLNHFTNEYYLETTSDIDAIASINHLFTQINDHFLQSEEFTLLTIPRSTYQESEPFNLDETTEALHLFDVDNDIEMSTEFDGDISEIEEIDGFLMIQLETENQNVTSPEIFKNVPDNASDELTTLFPSLLIEPFTGDLDDFLDDTSNNDLEEKLPMPELFVDIFSESPTEKFLGNDDETELQRVIWHDPEKDADLVEVKTAFTVSKSLYSANNSITDNSINNDFITDDFVLEDNDWEEVETSFNFEISDNITSDQFFTSLEANEQENQPEHKEQNIIFDGLVTSNQNSPAETSSMLSYASLDNANLDNANLDNDFTMAEMLADFPNSDIDTEIEESPIYQNKTREHSEDTAPNLSINLEEQEIDDFHLSGLSLNPTHNLHLNLGIGDVAKQSSSQLAPPTDNDAIIRLPIHHLEMLGDLSEELLVRKGSLDIYLGKLKVLAGEAHKHLQLLEPNAITKNQTAIADLQDAMEQITTVLDQAEQHTSAMSQDVYHLRTSLRQVLKHPISSLVRKFPRILRDLSLRYGKQVELIVQGAEIEVERLISEIITKPLELLLRNALEHGIEDLYTRQRLGKFSQGKIEFIATQTDENIVIKVIDDGCGIDIDKIRNQVEQSAAIAGMSGFSAMDMRDEQLLGLIFEPSYSISNASSTSSHRLSDVKKKLREIGGTISVQSQRGEGTQFTMVLPNMLSLIRVLLIEIDQICLAIPSKIIMEVIPITDDFHNDQEILQWGDRALPIVRLHPLLKLNCRPSLNSEAPQSNVTESGHSERDKPTNTIPSFLVINHESNLFALQTDGCWHDQEATFHQIEGDIGLPQIFLGTVILGSNQAVALLNPAELVSQLSPVHEALLISPNVPPSLDNLSGLSDFFEAKDIFPEPSRSTSLSPTERSPEPEKSQDDGLLKSTVITKQTLRSHQPRILIVESSANVRRYLAMMLTKSGFLTEQVQDSKEAISFLKECLALNLNVDVVITDLEMPHMDGFKLLSSIRGDVDLQNLPIVALTAKNNTNDQNLALELGANAYFSKPYREQELVSKLHQIISK